MKREFQAQGAYFMNAAEIDAVARVLVTPQRLPNPALVGKIGDLHRREVRDHGAAGDARPDRAARTASAATIPLSIEKLCPVLSYYVVKDWREGCERCKQILRYGGMGHTMSIHSQNDQVILEFGLQKPAFRIVVNSPTTHGSIGLSTGLDPAMTLGCGGYGGNITSDNISPRHLLNIKRVAYEMTPVVSRWDRAAGAQPTAASAAAGRAGSRARPAKRPGETCRAAGIGADALSRRIDAFLGGARLQARKLERVRRSRRAVRPETPEPAPLDFVCEEDVRLAIQAGRKLVVSERAIVTPAARDLGDSQPRVLRRALARVTASDRR